MRAQAKSRQTVWLQNALLPDIHHRSKLVRDYYFEGPLVVAPRDSPARFDPQFDRGLAEDPSVLPERYVVRVDYRIEAFQWGVARPPGPEDGMPSSGNLTNVAANSGP